ncbi:hypothetical protein MMC07_003804 [Pseudocyphellaria aurata]|nr:hypothetical protein [Pseudocyphellaria aurata]
MPDAIISYGWTAKSRDPKHFLTEKASKDPAPLTVEGIRLPDSPLAKRVLEYAEQELNAGTFNHSMRVFYYGKAIQIQQFPKWEFTDETYLLACLLHDIGTTDKNIEATRMSFEFYGGLLARNLLYKDYQAPIEQAESIAECIMRHQDIANSGSITTLGLIIQLATIFDNMGGHAELVHQGTIEDVTKHFPRNKWSSCFAATIRKENALKPWAHTTALGEVSFPEGVLNNTLMAPYD